MTPKELVEVAIAKGIDVLGISDHFEYLVGWFKPQNNIKLYLNVLSHMKKKYKDKIVILTGMEIDFPLFKLVDFPIEMIEKIDFVMKFTILINS